MSIKKRVKNGLEAIAKTAHEAIRNDVGTEDRHQDNVRMIVSAEMREAATRKLPLNDAVRYAEFLRGCIEPMTADVVVVKPLNGDPDVWSRRFDALIERLRTDISPLPLALARDLGAIADGYHGLSGAIDEDRWAGDQGYHFTLSSSSGRKARILSQAVWCTRPEKCLELGTAYGMSALFILETQKRLGLAPRLSTVEGAARQYAIASDTLARRYGDGVACHLGMTDEVLPRMLRPDRSIGFVFHDAGHDFDSYVNDFKAILPSLAPGAVLMMDDIRWEDARFSQTEADRTHAGWMAVVASPSVRTAIEVDGGIGVLLIR